MAGSILKRILQLLELASSVVLAAMMLLTFVDVVGRYILGAPVFGAAEMIETLLALTIFLGLGLANARDRHIVVELFDSRIRRLSPRVYDAMIQGFSILAMALIVYVLFQQTLEAAHHGAETIVLEWSLAWISGIVTALAALSLVSQILGLLTGAAQAGPPLEDLG